MKSVWTPFVPIRSDAKTCSNCYRTFYGLQGSAGTLARERSLPPPRIPYFLPPYF
jgi:hypothetical protein